MPEHWSPAGLWAMWAPGWVGTQFMSSLAGGSAPVSPPPPPIRPLPSLGPQGSPALQAPRVPMLLRWLAWAPEWACLCIQTSECPHIMSMRVYSLPDWQREGPHRCACSHRLYSPWEQTYAHGGCVS